MGKTHPRITFTHNRKGRKALTLRWKIISSKKFDYKITETTDKDTRITIKSIYGL